VILSPLQAKALRLLAECGPGTVRSGRDVHPAVADALIARRLATGRVTPTGRILDLTPTGQAVAASLPEEG
jgi:hypothetical protein